MSAERFWRFGGYNGGRSYRPSFFGGFSFFPPVIKALFLSNVGIFLFFAFFGPLTLGGVSVSYLLNRWFPLYPLEGNFYPWQVITYMFLHADFFHLLFNMFALWMFGMEIENVWGSKKFLLYYFICGVGAALSNLFIAPLFAPVSPNIPTVGASGGIYGVLLAFGLMFPDRYIIIFPFFIPIKSKYLVAIFIGLALLSGVSGRSDGLAHFAHLGGAAVGYLYLVIDSRRFPFEQVFGRVTSAWRSAVSRKGSYASEGPERIADANFFDVQESREKTEEEIIQEKIDTILDKISVSGYQSLTEEEKKILFDASRKLN